MLAMARILRIGARLLLLDEMTEGLAPVIVQALGRVVRDLKDRGLTIVMVEQNFRFVAPFADRHFLIEHGRIVDVVSKDHLGGRMDDLHKFLGV
jgi:branched-chain amino acid transport system ATP-binding protein